MDTPELLEGRLLAAIGALAASPETCARSPGRDFTRSRKLPLGELVRLLVVMGAGTLGVELGRCLRGAPAGLPDAAPPRAWRGRCNAKPQHQST